MSGIEPSEICQRIGQVRLEVAGPRGKSAFAKKLGLSPSTYIYYETSRVPPADVLVGIADVAAVDLRWLLTGQRAGEPRVPADHPVLQRAARLLADRPNAAAPLAAFLEILAASLTFPPREPTEAAAPPAGDLGEESTSWIPVLGRSAAGIVQFWSAEDSSAGLTTLNDLIARHARAEHSARDARGRGEQTGEFPVQLVTLTSPAEDVAEFVATAGLKAVYPNAFAVRIDGESMAPDIRHGDLVIVSPSAQAVDGKAAVVQLRNQIGVTCKLFRREGGRVHLVPVNEQFAPQSYAAETLAWALRVLARVRT
jgi:transcriptional regulator with XRE-family HTH domain